MNLPAHSGTRLDPADRRSRSHNAYRRTAKLAGTGVSHALMDQRSLTEWPIDAEQSLEYGHPGVRVFRRFRAGGVPSRVGPIPSGCDRWTWDRPGADLGCSGLDGDHGFPITCQFIDSRDDVGGLLGSRASEPLAHEVDECASDDVADV